MNLGQGPFTRSRVLVGYMGRQLPPVKRPGKMLIYGRRLILVVLAVDTLKET